MKNRPSTYLVILIFLLFLVGKGLTASPQLPDYLIFKGDTFPVYNLILEKYFEKIHQSDQGSLFGLKFRDSASFNCWRGYQAIYKIENDSLYLSNIIACGERLNHKSIDLIESNKRINDIFKTKVINNKVFIDWYKGNVCLPNGKLLRWDGVFSKTFENEILISIENGIVKKEKKIVNYIDNPDKINRRFNDTISNILFEKIGNRNLGWKKLDKCGCADRYIVTIGRNGKVNDVQFAEYQTKKDIRKYWDRADYNLCIKSIYKALKKLRFDIIKQCGVPVAEKKYLQIWYEEKTGQIENWTR